MMTLFGAMLGLGDLAIWIVAIAAIVALVYVFVRASGLAVPAWLVQVFWIVAAAVVVIAAIRFVMSL